MLARFHSVLHSHRCLVVAPHSCIGQTSPSGAASKGNKIRSILMTESAKMGENKQRRSPWARTMATPSSLPEWTLILCGGLNWNVANVCGIRSVVRTTQIGRPYPICLTATCVEGWQFPSTTDFAISSCLATILDNGSVREFWIVWKIEATVSKTW